MALATLAAKKKVLSRAAIFTCSSCDGWVLANGYKASPFQVHHRHDKDTVTCVGCGKSRPIFLDGEAISVRVRLWPDLPAGI